MYSKSIQCSERSCNHYAYLQRFWRKKMGLHKTVLFFYWSFTTNNHCTLPRSMIHCINQQRVSTRDCTRHDGRNLGASHVIHRELRLHCQHCKKSLWLHYARTATANIHHCTMLNCAAIHDTYCLLATTIFWNCWPPPTRIPVIQWCENTHLGSVKYFQASIPNSEAINHEWYWIMIHSFCRKATTETGFSIAPEMFPTWADQVEMGIDRCEARLRLVSTRPASLEKTTSEWFLWSTIQGRQTVRVVARITDPYLTIFPRCHFNQLPSQFIKYFSSLRVWNQNPTISTTWNKRNAENHWTVHHVIIQWGQGVQPLNLLRRYEKAAVEWCICHCFWKDVRFLNRWLSMTSTSTADWKLKNVSDMFTWITGKRFWFWYSSWVWYQ